MNYKEVSVMERSRYKVCVLVDESTKREPKGNPEGSSPVLSYSCRGLCQGLAILPSPR